MHQRYSSSPSSSSRSSSSSSTSTTSTGSSTTSSSSSSGSGTPPPGYHKPINAVPAVLPCPPANAPKDKPAAKNHAHSKPDSCAVPKPLANVTSRGGPASAAPPPQPRPAPPPEALTEAEQIAAYAMGWRKRVGGQDQSQNGQSRRSRQNHQTQTQAGGCIEHSSGHTSLTARAPELALPSPSARPAKEQQQTAHQRTSQRIHDAAYAIALDAVSKLYGEQLRARDDVVPARADTSSSGHSASPHMSERRRGKLPALPPPHSSRTHPAQSHLHPPTRGPHPASHTAQPSRPSEPHTSRNGPSDADSDGGFPPGVYAHLQGLVVEAMRAHEANATLLSEVRSIQGAAGPGLEIRTGAERRPPNDEEEERARIALAKYRAEYVKEPGEIVDWEDPCEDEDEDDFEDEDEDEAKEEDEEEEQDELDPSDDEGPAPQPMQDDGGVKVEYAAVARAAAAAAGNTNVAAAPAPAPTGPGADDDDDYPVEVIEVFSSEDERAPKRARPNGPALPNQPKRGRPPKERANPLKPGNKRPAAKPARGRPRAAPGAAAPHAAPGVAGAAPVRGHIRWTPAERVLLFSAALREPPYADRFTAAVPGRSVRQCEGTWRNTVYPSIVRFLEGQGAGGGAA